VPAGLVDIEKLTTIGLFPENLPPVFTPKNIWACFAGLGNDYAITSNCVGEHATYNASKRGGQRRIFGIPHPAFVRDVAVFFEKKWADIFHIIDSLSNRT
jgi:hypothetical protein